MYCRKIYPSKGEQSGHQTKKIKGKETAAIKRKVGMLRDKWTLF